MRVIRWKNAVTGVESLNITATGIYFPVGKADSSFIARYSMASAEQTASVERVSSPNGSRVGSPAINVSGTTEVVVNERRGLSTGIIVTAISGTLISVLDDNTPITNFPDAGLGRFPAKEDADAYVYGSTVPQGLLATIGGVPYSWSGSAWAAVGGGGSSSAARLPRPIAVATFGDSTAFVTPSNYAADIATVAAMPISIPGSGQIAMGINTTTMIGLYQAPLIRYVGDFGKNGQDTNGMLARSNGVYSSTRKSIGDLTRVSPDVVIMRGGSVNDVAPMNITTPQSTVDAVAVRHIAIVKKILSLGYPVIDSGILGYDGNGSVPAPRLAFIRAAIVRINGLISSGLANAVGYTFINPEGLTSNGGAFITGIAFDGTHLSAYGAGIIAAAQSSALSAIFSPNVDGICVSEFEVDWANPSGGRPANLTASNVGVSDLISTTTSGIFSASFTASNPGQGLKLALGDLSQNMATLANGDKFSIRWRLNLKDADGKKVAASPFFEFLLYESTNTGDFYINLSQMSVSDGDIYVNTPIFVMDRAGSALGTKSLLQITVSAPAAGNYVLTAHPPQVLKHA